MSLESVTERIRNVLPQLATLDARVKFLVEDEGVILVDAREKPPVISHDDGEADCTVRLSEQKLHELLDGRLSPTLAYTLGQLKVEGSLGIAMRLANALES
jgi:putative sterol carrier protein